MYEKLGIAGCMCLCNTVHPATHLCRGSATGDVLADVMGTPITIPMCRPCADAILTAEIAKTEAVNP